MQAGMLLEYTCIVERCDPVRWISSIVESQWRHGNGVQSGGEVL